MVYVVWDNCTQEQNNLLKSVQIRVGRIITRLRLIRQKHKLTLLYKLLLNMLLLILLADYLPCKIWLGSVYQLHIIMPYAIIISIIILIIRTVAHYNCAFTINK